MLTQPVHATVRNEPVQAKIRSSSPDSTRVLIRTHRTAIQAEFGQVVPCEFPIWASAPVHVEIPPGGMKSFIVGPFSGSITQKPQSGDFPTIIKFPVYREQQIVPAMAFDELDPVSANALLVKMPVAALATTVSGVDDGRLVQVHSVLPFWNDGSTVLVRLDWFEGDLGEGMPNPEWHMMASGGVPARLGLSELRAVSRLPPLAKHCRFQINLTPSVLGAHLLNDKGEEIPHPVWQREWAFDRFADFSAALDIVTRGLLGIDPSDTKNAA
jgi:hypothetical protein